MPKYARKRACVRAKRADEWLIFYIFPRRKNIKKKFFVFFTTPMGGWMCTTHSCKTSTGLAWMQVNNQSLFYILLFFVFFLFFFSEARGARRSIFEFYYLFFTLPPTEGEGETNNKNSFFFYLRLRLEKNN